MLIAFAASQSELYFELKMPVTIVVKTEDRLIDPEEQSARLYADLPHSRLKRLAANGHMVHQTATGAVMHAINRSGNGFGNSD